MKLKKVDLMLLLREIVMIADEKYEAPEMKLLHVRDLAAKVIGEKELIGGYLMPRGIGEKKKMKKSKKGKTK